MADPIYDPNALFGATSTQTNPDAGNAPFTQVYGQRRSSPLSMDEYLSGSMYDFPGINTGIDVSAAPDLNEDEDDDDAQAAPNILTPVSERTDDPSSVFRAISQGGQLGTGYRVSAKDPSSYLDDLLSGETFTVKEDGFSKYAQQKFKEGGGMVTAAVTPAMGMPITVVAAGAAAFAEKQNKKNAEAILQTGGGDLFDLNGATVSRAPGERIFTGNLGGFSQEQLYAAREMDFGFIPGSMREFTPVDPYAVEGKAGIKTNMKRTGNRGVQAAGQVSGHIMDAYGTIHGTRDESGVMQVGAIAAQRMRENEFRQNMIDAGLQSKLDEMIADNSFTMNAVRAKQHADGIMKAGQGFRFRAANVPADQYAKALNDRGETYQDYVKSTHGTTPTTKVDTSQAEAQAAATAAAVRQSQQENRESDRENRESDARGGPRGAAQERQRERSDSGMIGDRFGGGDAYGGVITSGRVGMAAGDTPQGTFEPGFVKGPPENFTERETVADDQNGKVKPDTFIINAAAVEIAGSEDIRKMLMKAYEVAVQKGLDIGRVDRKLYEGTVDVALSKGEVVVPPELAKIIGYDRLRKINNRGKKEVASRQKKAGGGFLNGKKFAEGGEAEERRIPYYPASYDNPALDYEDKIIRDEVSRKIKLLLANFEKQSKGEKVYTEDYDPDSVEKEYRQAFARLNNQLEIKGDYSAAGDDVNAPTTPTLINLFVLAEELAHSDFYRNPEALQRENPYPRITPGSVTDENFLGDYNPKHFLFEAESDFLEEMRAKQIAFATVGGLLPKGQRTASYTRDSYKQGFLSFLKADVAIGDTSPEVAAELIKKYNLDDIPDYKYPFGQDDLDKYRSIKEQMFRSARGDEKDLMLYDAENPTARFYY